MDYAYPPWTRRRSMLGQKKLNTDTTPLMDPLRTSRLHPPYYGVQAVGHMSSATALVGNERVALAAKAREKEQELLGMYALLNAGVPINQLPVELLVEIFALLQRIDVTNVCGWLNTLRVCRHWFVVGSTAGTLWKNLKVRGCTNLLRTGLARSRGAEINVEMVCTHNHPLADAAFLIAPHIHRLRSLRLGRVPTSYVTALTNFMAHSMPALRHFHAIADPHVTEPVLDFPQVRFPRLEELQITHIHVFRDLDVFAQLRVVNISDCFGSLPALTTRTLLEALRCMENVEELNIYNVAVCDLGSSSAFASADSVLLKKLISAVIRTDGPLIKQMLSAVTFPPTAVVDFCAPLRAWTPAGNTHSMGAILPSDRRCLPILTRIVDARIVASASQRCIDGYLTPNVDAREVPQLTLTLDLCDDDLSIDLPADLSDLVDVLRDAPLELVTIETTAATIAETDWHDLFAAFPRLRSLDLIVSLDDVLVSADVVFAALDPGDAAAPASESPGEDAAPRSDTNGVLCPQLQTVTVSGLSATPETLLETIATCLEKRRRRLGKPDGRALETLVLGLMDHTDQAAFAAAKAAYEERLAPLVGTLQYFSSDF